VPGFSTSGVLHSKLEFIFSYLSGDIMKTPQRIVVKIGTSTLTAGSTKLSVPHIVDLVRQIAQLHTEEYQIVLVSSGAVAAGRETLDFPELPKFIPAKQMLAAVGQPRLIAIYDRLFEIYGKTVAQVLLTRSDLSNHRRYLNARNTLEALLAQGVIPIVNENDTVATEEIRVGDNDNLSALVCNLLEADLLILLTDQEGVFTSDPQNNKDAQLIPEIREPVIPDAVWQAAGTTHNGIGTGGMTTKLQAADLARRSGSSVVITRGSAVQVISKVVAGEIMGTRFPALASKVESHKRFILAGSKTNGQLTVDSGAVKALLDGKSSLLPIGVIAVQGEFERGESISVVDQSGKQIALGLASYNTNNMVKIVGHHSSEIEEILGYTYGDDLIRRENMIFL
jgi:glutamate 5-kinase